MPEPADEKRLEAYQQREETVIGRAVNRIVDSYQELTAPLTGQMPTRLVAADDAIKQIIERAEMKLAAIQPELGSTRPGASDIAEQLIHGMVRDAGVIHDFNQVELSLIGENHADSKHALEPVHSSGRDTGR